MLGSINNRGKVSEPCLSSPIITLHRGTLSIPPPPPKGERPNGSFTQWSVTVHQSQVIIVVSLLLLSFGQLKSFPNVCFSKCHSVTIEYYQRINKPKIIGWSSGYDFSFYKFWKSFINGVGCFVFCMF